MTTELPPLTLDRVCLVVHIAPVDSGGSVGKIFWVYVHTDPPDAEVHFHICTPDGKKKPTVRRLGLADATRLSLPPYFNSVFQVEHFEPGVIYRMDLKGSECKHKHAGRADGQHSFLFWHLKKENGGYGEAQITIGTPPNDGNVSAANGFMTAGNVSPTTASMSAWIVKQAPGAKPIPGVPAVPPPTYDWAFSFGGGLTAGATYTLNVQGVTDVAKIVPEDVIAN